MAHIQQHALRRYRLSQLSAMSRLERLLVTYDIAVAAANGGDAPRLMKALAVLRGALCFDEHAEIAMGLLRLFRFCETAVEERQAFHEAAQILYALREAWSMAADGHEIT